MAGENSLSLEETLCHRRKLSITGENYHSRKLYHRRKISDTVGNWQKRKFLQERTITRGNYLSQEETITGGTLWHRRKLPITGRNSLSQEETLYHRRKLSNSLSSGQPGWVEDVPLVIYELGIERSCPFSRHLVEAEHYLSPPPDSCLFFFMFVIPYPSFTVLYPFLLMHFPHPPLLHQTER